MEMSDFYEQGSNFNLTLTLKFGTDMSRKGDSIGSNPGTTHTPIPCHPYQATLVTLSWQPHEFVRPLHAKEWFEIEG